VAVTTLRLPPTDTSASQARRWVTAELGAAPLDVLERAVLLVSEVVTNAVLHAETEIVLSLVTATDHWRIEVADECPDLPAPRHYDLEATTGRGLCFLSALALDWGVTTTQRGKTIWFVLAPRTDRVRPDRHLAATGVGSLVSSNDEDDAVICLRGLPVRLFQHTAEQYEGLFRELRLLTGDAQSTTVPRQLVGLREVIDWRISTVIDEHDAEVHAALAEGLDVVDLEYRLPRDVGDTFAHLDRLLDEADAYCSRGDLLLTLSPSPAARALRKWLLGQLVDQIAGRAPTAWSDSEWASELSDGSRPEKRGP
jgi:anti-sigma regulatory factor (Ser/Thr protein kinase)